MTGNPVSWFGIHAADLDRAKKFYETVFGETLQEVGGGGMRFMIFGADWAKYGVSGMLWSDGGAVPGYGGTTVFFNFFQLSRWGGTRPRRRGGRRPPVAGQIPDCQRLCRLC